MSEANQACRCDAANVVLNSLLDELECDPQFPGDLVRDTLVRMLLERDEEIEQLKRLLQKFTDTAD
jgi:hypothetical protein